MFGNWHQCCIYTLLIKIDKMIKNYMFLCEKIDCLKTFCYHHILYRSEGRFSGYSTLNHWHSCHEAAVCSSGLSCDACVIMNGCDMAKCHKYLWQGNIIRDNPQLSSCPCHTQFPPDLDLPTWKFARKEREWGNRVKQKETLYH